MAIFTHQIDAEVGVEMSDWCEIILEQFVSLQRGHDLTEAERKDGCVPVLGAAGQNGFHDTAICKGPGVVIGRSGASFGKVHYCKTDFWPHNTSLYVTDFHGNEPLFAYYFLKNIDFDRYNSGSAQPSLNRNFIYPIEIKVPCIEIQQAIAHILGTFDDKIELNRRMNETLEAMARAIFKSWFVDFDPVHAKMSGEPCESICRRLGLTPELLDFFPDRLQDSELGKIPEGWKAGRIADLAGFLGGYAFKSKNWIEAGVPVVKIGSVKPGIVDLNAVSFVSDEVADEAKRFRLASGDLLIGMTGYVGEVGLVPITDKPPLLNQRVGKFILETPGTSAMAFLYCLARSAEFKSYVETKSHGTAQANVSADAILSISIVVPHKALRDKFNIICSPILDRILQNHAESQSLSAIRDSLLPKFLSGELRAPVKGEA